jgi:hypothetical protein
MSLVKPEFKSRCTIILIHNNLSENTEAKMRDKAPRYQRTEYSKVKNKILILMRTAQEE